MSECVSPVRTADGGSSSARPLPPAGHGRDPNGAAGSSRSRKRFPGIEPVEARYSGSESVVWVPGPCLASVVVADFDVLRTTFRPAKADPLLIVDPYAVVDPSGLPSKPPVDSPVEIFEKAGRIQGIQPPASPAPEIPRQGLSGLLFVRLSASRVHLAQGGATFRSATRTGRREARPRSRRGPPPVHPAPAPDSRSGSAGRRTA